jgi:hypothetical protein
VGELGKASFGLDEHCLSFVLLYPDLLILADEVLRASEDEALKAEDFRRADDRAIFLAWRQWLAQGGDPDVRGEFYDTLDVSMQGRVQEVIEIQEGQPPAPEDLLRSQVPDAITKLRLQNLRRYNQELRFLHEDAQASGDRDSLRSYGQLVVEVGMRIRRLEQSMNARSISGRRQRVDAAVRVPAGQE